MSTAAGEPEPDKVLLFSADPRLREQVAIGLDDAANLIVVTPPDDVASHLDPPPSCVLLDLGPGEGAAQLDACPPGAVVLLRRPATPESLLEAARTRGAEVISVDALADGGVRRAVHLVQARRRVQQLEVENERLQTLAHRDALTGLLNRRGLEHVLEVERARTRRSGCRLAAVLVDCDDFKRINDRYGHDVGDVVLRSVGDSIRGSVRPTDFSARIGGDEFLVLLTDVRGTEAAVVAERIRSAIAARTFVETNEEEEVTVSIGWSWLSQDQLSVETILRLVGGALRRSKTIGKDAVSVRGNAPSQPEPKVAGSVPRPVRELDEEARELLRTLRALMSGQALRVVGQPIRELSRDQIVGYELCARGPEGGPFEPAEQFLRLASETDKTTEVDLSCLRACATVVGRLMLEVVSPPPAAGDAASEALLRGDTLPSGSPALTGAHVVAAAAHVAMSRRVHVNVFPSTLPDRGVADVLAAIRPLLQQMPVCVELSDRRIVGAPGRLRDHVRSLQAAGVTVALDDVGFSRGALEALILLEPDMLKLDRQFVIGCHADRGKHRTLSRLLELAWRLEVDVVAVGIETEHELHVVRELGVGFGQGFYWGQPTPFGDG